MCQHRPRLPGRQDFQSLFSTCSTTVLTWSTQSTLPCTLTLVDVPKCQPPQLVTRWLRSLGPSPGVHPSPLWVHRHEPAWPLPPPSTTVSELHTCTPQAERHVAHPKLTLRLVQRFKPKCQHIDNHSSKHRTTWVHIDRVFAISPLMSALLIPHGYILTGEQKKQNKRKEKRTHPNDQKPMKSQNRVIWNEQNLQSLVPKDMGNGSMHPSKTQLALKKRQKGLNTTSKAQNTWKLLVPPERGKGSTQLAKINSNATLSGQMQSLKWMHSPLFVWNLCVEHFLPLIGICTHHAQKLLLPLRKCYECRSFMNIAIRRKRCSKWCCYVCVAIDISASKCSNWSSEMKYEI
jgi:hypothetical protein